MQAEWEMFKFIFYSDGLGVLAIMLFYSTPGVILAFMRKEPLHRSSAGQVSIMLMAAMILSVVANFAAAFYFVHGAKHLTLDYLDAVHKNLAVCINMLCAGVCMLVVYALNIIKFYKIRKARKNK